jgi:hypothetical protein
MATRMQQRRGTAAQWISTNSGNGPILAPGEIGFESDTNKFKLGDGVNHWIDLDYFTTDSAEAITQQINTAISNLVDGAPGVLNTLNELAAAINDDPTFFTTIATNLSNHESDTTNVHGILDTNELATKEYVTQEIGNATADYPDLAGTGLTWDLENEQFAVDTTVIQERVTGVSDTEIGYLSNVTSDIQSQINDKLSSSDLTEAAQEAVNSALVAGVGLDKTYNDLNNTITLDIDSTVATKTYADDAAEAAQAEAELTASGALSTHSSDTTSVHGITDTAELATKTFAANLLTGATKSNITITGDKNGLNITAENGVADSTTSDLTEGTNLYFTDERAQDAVGNSVGTGLTYTDSTGVISVAANTYDAFGSASAVAGDLSTHASDTTTHGTTGDIVGTSDTQTLTNKTLTSPKINEDVALTATATELNTLDGITASTGELNILDGATLTVTELNYVDGVTSPVQTQLDDRLSKAGGTMTGDITLPGMPTQALHAATKSYVDSVSEGLHIHASAIAATTGNVSIATDLEPGDLVDGVTLVEGNRILVKSQTNSAQNGIYVVQASGAALRAADFNEPLEVDGGDFIFVTGGETHENTGWVQTTTNLVTIGTDPIAFTQFSGAGTYLAGTGLELTDNVFSIDTATTVDVSTAQTLTNKTISAATNILTIATTDLTDVTATASEINVLDGITANTLELNILDGATLSTAEINILDGITASTNELNYVEGVTSAIQDQLNSKINSSTAASTYAPIESPTFTGAVSGIDKSMVGLDNVDNTADLDKPISTDVQEELDLKASLESPTFTGTVVLPNDTVTNDMLSGLIANSKLVNSSITINGSAVSLGDSTTISGLPSQDGNQGKYLTTDGEDATWAAVDSGPAIKNNGSAMTSRPNLNLIGFSALDDSVNSETDVIIYAGLAYAASVFI